MWVAAVHEVLGSLALETPVNCHSELMDDSLRNIEPVQLGVEQMCQVSVELPSITDDTGWRHGMCDENVVRETSFPKSYDTGRWPQGRPRVPSLLAFWGLFLVHSYYPHILSVFSSLFSPFIPLLSFPKEVNKKLNYRVQLTRIAS